jgi:hypothetical protein
MFGWDWDIGGKSNNKSLVRRQHISGCISYNSVLFRISGGILAARQSFIHPIQISIHLNKKLIKIVEK